MNIIGDGRFGSGRHSERPINGEPCEVVDLDDERPHLVIDCGEISGAVYMVPVTQVAAWASGERHLVNPDIMRCIIGEWLAYRRDSSTVS